MAMKRLPAAILAIFLGLAGQAQRCDSDLRFAGLLQRDPEVAARQQAIETFTREWIREQDPAVRGRSIITIPVVIHVVWQMPEENISDDQIQSQLDVLSEDFRLLNNLTLIPGNFLPFAADVELEFCLARRTPEGEPTTGIVRVPTAVNNVGTALAGGERAIYYSDLGGSDAWDPTTFLNIWLGRRQFFPGEASFPAEGLANPAEDGIVIDPAFFGTSGSVSPPYHLGRTLTHEIGHYFNLFHLWGPGGEGSCMEDDEVADTPLQSVTYVGECPFGPQFSCGTPDMYMNYMNFTDDACMALFTTGQKARMLAALHGPRAGLLFSDGCIPASAVDNREDRLQFKLFPNPGSRQVTILLPPALHFPVRLLLLDPSGRILQQQTLNTAGSYQLDLPSALPDGFYLIKMDDGSEIFTKKLIIVR